MVTPAAMVHGALRGLRVLIACLVLALGAAAPGAVGESREPAVALVQETIVVTSTVEPLACQASIREATSTLPCTGPSATRHSPASLEAHPNGRHLYLDNEHLLI